MTLDNVMATPWSEGHDQRWIDNRAAILRLNNCRFGGEDGGILTVLNFAKYSTHIAYETSIIIDNCFVCNQTNLKTAGRHLLRGNPQPDYGPALDDHRDSRDHGRQ